MTSKRKYTCDICCRNYSTKQNLKRHISAKHIACNLQCIDIRCTICKKQFNSVELFKKHVNMDSQNPGENSVSLESVGTPLQDEGQSLAVAPWIALQPPQRNDIAGGAESQQALYEDIQDYVQNGVYSPVSDFETLPDPEPLAKKGKRKHSSKNKEEELSTILVRIDSLEKRMEDRFLKIEGSLDRLSDTAVGTIKECASKQQHYCRSLTAVLQRDIKSVKESVQSLQKELTVASSGQKLPMEVIKSIVDLNGSLTNFIRSTE